MLLSSNWEVEENLDITTFIEEYSAQLSNEVAELLQEEKCFILNKSVDEYCCLQIACPHLVNSTHCSSGKYIDKITILSEAKLIEVYVGKYEEYVSTYSSNVVDQFGDATLCRCDIELSKPYSSIKLSLKSTFENTSIMVFGIFAKIKYVDAKNAARFTSSHLDEVFVDRTVKLSKDAQYFKQALQNFNDAAKAPSDSSASGLPLSVLPFLSAMNAPKSSSDSVVPYSVAATEEGAPGGVSTLPTGMNISHVLESLKQNCETEIKSDLQSYITSSEGAVHKIITDSLDKKFEELEAKLTSFVDAKISQHTDIIMNKLSEIENKLSK